MSDKHNHDEHDEHPDNHESDGHDDGHNGDGHDDGHQGGHNSDDNGNPNTPIEVKVRPTPHTHEFHMHIYGFEKKSDYIHYKNQNVENRSLPNKNQLVLAERIEHLSDAIELINAIENGGRLPFIEERIKLISEKHQEKYPQFEGFGFCFIIHYLDAKKMELDWILAFGKNKPATPPLAPSEKPKIIESIQKSIAELEKLHPEAGDFWDKTDKSAIVKKIVEDLKKLESAVSNETSKKVISKYTYKINQFAENLPKMKGTQANQYKGSTQQLIKSVNAILDEYTKD